MKIDVIIPARYGSTRLPGKPLEDICGKPMIQRVYEGVSSSKRVNRIIVATDNEKIKNTVIDFGGEAVLTNNIHENGTSRATEVAEHLDSDYVIIVQGDEPMIYTEAIDSLIDHITSDVLVYSLMQSITEGIDSIERAKVIADLNGFAMTFSRSRIPFNFNDKSPTYYKGVGVYAFQREFLLKYINLPMGKIEAAEGIELLRVIEHGYKVKMIEIKNKVYCVDTPADIERVRISFEEGY